MRTRLTALLVSVGTVSFPLLASATTALDRLNKVGETAFPGQRERQAPEVVGQIIQWFIGILGVLFVALMVYGGYLWMNARGNEQQVEKAKTLITQAVIGLVVVLAAYSITYFVVINLVNATGGAPAT